MERLIHTPAMFSITRNAFRSSQIEALYHVSDALAHTHDLGSFLRKVLQILHIHAGMGRGAILLTDPETGGLIVQAIGEEYPLPAKRVCYLPGEGILGLIVSSGQAMIIENPSLDSRFIHRLGLLDPILPFIGVPIFMNDHHVAGVIAVQPMFGNRDLLRDQGVLLEIIANLLAQEIRKTKTTDESYPWMGSESLGLDPREDGDTLVPGLEKWMESKVMRPVLQCIVQAAKWDSVVLIQGESGTGKEVAASAIHQLSSRADEPFVKVNCAALSDNLLESELFGHEKGAFTGAINTRKGRFELADRGTLFLDEIGEISPSFQSKLLRVIQEGTFERVGGTRTLRTEVRIVAATNRDLYQEVQQGRFRADLFYRLFVFPIQMPPLRDRREDIPWLADILLKRIGNRQKRLLQLSSGALTTLCHADWPGNVRELENTLERAAIMSVGGQIDATHIFFPGPGGMVIADGKPGAASMDPEDSSLTERERVMAALEKSGWVQAKAARMLNMTPRQIAYRVKILGIPIRQL
ncbi:MAG: nif-specific transcriptional activator NifA [Magnetococcus sp. THC-1_WYH]